MNTKGKEIIAELDQAAKEKEEAFLNRIANRLNRPRITEKPEQPVRGVPEYWKSYRLSSDERIELFMKNWQGLGGEAKRFATKEELAVHIAKVADSMTARSIIRENNPLLEELRLDDRLSKVDMTVWKNESSVDLLEKAAVADIGVGVVDFAIAHTGTVVVTSGLNKGRSISLLPTAFMAIIRAEDIRTRMGEVMSEIHKWNGNCMPAGIHFITGPSRSADIENDLTIGVHGPGIVFAYILG
ncbi:LutC/YkgG family protein [Brevibacillus ginsengisoli]|uniref:LutC/YkgG family protein n=1 Tax=Brevibacillus ginsengisoli TaxID=363854 RepID=UPI003CF02665